MLPRCACRVRSAAATPRARLVGASTIVGATLLLASCGLRQPVDIARVIVGKDERELIVLLGTCEQNESVQVVETDTTVRLSAEADRPIGGTGGCTEMVSVTLKEPVGDR